METLKSKVDAAVKALRKASPEWGNLMAALRANAFDPGLADLAEAALVDANALADLRQQLAAARAAEGAAGRWPEVSKAWGRLEQDLADAERRLGQAGNDDERKPIADEVERLQAQQGVLLQEYSTCKTAAIRVAAARAEGLI